ncbi:MAG: chemotaxis protein CheX [Chthoniobacterales bacterium]
MKPKLSSDDLTSIATRATTEVLAVQLKRVAEPVTPGDERLKEVTGQHLHATVTLAGERIVGAVLFQVPVEFAAKVAKQLLGNDTETDDSKDVTGELGNMISGLVKGELSSAGYHGTLGTPTVTLGSRIILQAPADSEFCTTEWSCEGHLLSLQIHLSHPHPAA